MGPEATISNRPVERTLIDRVRAYLDELRRRALRPRPRHGARDPMTQRAEEYGPPPAQGSR